MFHRDDYLIFDTRLLVYGKVVRAEFAFQGVQDRLDLPETVWNGDVRFGDLA